MIKCCHRCKERWQEGLERCHSTCARYIRENEKHQADLKRENTRSWVDGVKKALVVQTKERLR